MYGGYVLAAVTGVQSLYTIPGPLLYLKIPPGFGLFWAVSGLMPPGVNLFDPLKHRHTVRGCAHSGAPSRTCERDIHPGPLESAMAALSSVSSGLIWGAVCMWGGFRFLDLFFQIQSLSTASKKSRGACLRRRAQPSTVTAFRCIPRFFTPGGQLGQSLVTALKEKGPPAVYA